MGLSPYSFCQKTDSAAPFNIVADVTLREDPFSAYITRGTYLR